MRLPRDEYDGAQPRDQIIARLVDAGVTVRGVPGTTLIELIGEDFVEVHDLPLVVTCRMIQRLYRIVNERCGVPMAYVDFFRPAHARLNS